MQRPVGLPRRADGFPALRHEAGDVPDGVEAEQIWSHAGFRTSAQKVLLHLTRRLSGVEPDAEGVTRLIERLAEFSLLSPVKLHGYRKSIELYQVGDDGLKLALAVEGGGNAARHLRPGRARRTRPARRAPAATATSGLSATDKVHQSRYARRARSDDRAAGRPGAYRTGLRRAAQGDRGGVQGQGPADEPAVLYADAGDGHRRRRAGCHHAAEHPATARQLRPEGRPSRPRSRVGLVVGYARSTPHDQYFFDHADEMIAGAVPAPVFLLGNQDAVSRHLHAIACGLATPGLPARMGDLVTFEGQVKQEELDALKAGLRAAAEPALAIACDAFGPDVLAEAEFDAQRLRAMLERLPERVQEAIDRTAVQIKKLRSVLDVLYTTGERKREAGRTVDLINKLLGTVGGGRPGGRHGRAYPLRRLAEFRPAAGLRVPHRAGDAAAPGRRGRAEPDPERSRAGAEAVPAQCPGLREGPAWRVIGVDLASPWNPTGGQAAWPYVRCGRCKLIRDAQGAPKCPRCSSAGAAGELPAMAYAGFLGRLDNAAVADEEERWGAKDNVQVHPSWDAEQVAGRWCLPDGWSLEWRRAERIYWLNEGPEQDGVRRRYPICPDCGKLLDTPPPAPSRRKGTRVPAKPGAGPDPYDHMPNCPRKGQPVGDPAGALRRAEGRDPAAPVPLAGLGGAAGPAAILGLDAGLLAAGRG